MVTVGLTRASQRFQPPGQAFENHCRVLYSRPQLLLLMLRIQARPNMISIMSPAFSSLYSWSHHLFVFGAPCNAHSKAQAYT